MSSLRLLKPILSTYLRLFAIKELCTVKCLTSRKEENMKLSFSVSHGFKQKSTQEVNQPFFLSLIFQKLQLHFVIFISQMIYDYIKNISKTFGMFDIDILFEKFFNFKALLQKNAFFKS